MKKLKILKKTRLLVLCFFITTPLWAQQELLEMKLHNCIEYALDNGIPVSLAKLTELESDQMVREVTSQALPQLYGYGSFDDNLNIPVQILPGDLVGQPGTTIEAKFGQQYVMGGGLQLDQKLFDQSIFIGMDAARRGREFYALNTKLSEEDVIYQITSDYLQALIIQDQQQVYIANLDMIKQLAEVAEYQFEAGVIKKTDLSRIQVNQTNIETNILYAQSQLDAQYNILKFHMGMPINTNVTLIDTIDVFKGDYYEEPTLESSVIDNRTEYQMITKQEQIRMLDIKNFKAGYYPTLSGYARHGYNAQRDEMNFTDGSEPWFSATVVGLALHVPIFNGFRKDAQIQQAKLRLQKTNEEKRNTVLSINLEFENALSRLDNSKASLLAQEKNVVLAVEVYNINQESYEQGITSLTELLNSGTEMTLAKSNYNEALLNYKIAQLQILKAKGQLKTLIN